jgi:hypothetical protein
MEIENLRGENKARSAERKLHLACRLANFHASVSAAARQAELYAITANPSHIGAALAAGEAEAF